MDSDLDSRFRERWLSSIDVLLKHMKPEAMARALAAPDLSGFVTALAVGCPVWIKEEHRAG